MILSEHIGRLNNYPVADLSPLYLDGACVGWVTQENIPLLQNAGLTLNVGANGVHWPAPAEMAARNEILARAAENLYAEGVITGWRDELLPVKSDFSAPTLAVVERAAMVAFGFKSYGVHLNGLTHKNGIVHMWLARRSLSKSVEPGKLDQIVAGGIPYDMDVKANLLKEAQEEAAIPPEIVNNAYAVGHFSYHQKTRGGVSNDTIFNYDLWLPEDFTPHNHDGEVSAFYCLPIADVTEWLRVGNDFKSNAAVVVLDFLLRYSVLPPDEADYARSCQLRQNLYF